MTLTLALSMLAGLVLLAVVVHGAWAARRAAPKPLRGERTELGEPGLGREAQGDGRQEPRLEPTLGEPSSAHGSEPSGGANGPMFAEPGRPLGALSPMRRSLRIDALIDAIATVTPEAPLAGELALQHLPASRRAGAKPFHIEGLNAETGEWELTRGGQRYGDFQAGLQMANRNGPLNEIEYSEFVQKIQAFADALGATADFPDMLDVVARARELDGFASQHDAQIVSLLRANSVAWSVGYIQQAAGRHGFVPGAVAGRMVLPSGEEGAPPMVVLAFDSQAALADDPGQAALRSISLSLDVPQSLESAEPFAAWQECARRLAEDLDATLVDDQGTPITLHAFAAIGQELQRLYRALEARDLAAGSAVARRLFS
ncbi:cell division protein ZipA C-terminal FtsZ-binding domain-containing protein [Ideonella sp.]|uniref:cell division protein ZipA C-terminal FtsZ-binding domain-containing protein n=1 Tax=Ideonella sp. TaxID=1929293 RepID=UPI003BB778C3